MSPFPLVPRGPLGPLMFASCGARSNRSKDIAGTEIVVGAGLCDGEGERAYIGFAPHYTFAFKKSVFADVDNCFAHFAEFRCPLRRKKICKMGKVGTLCRIWQTVPYSLGFLQSLMEIGRVAVNRLNFSGRKDRGRSF